MLTASPLPLHADSSVYSAVAGVIGAPANGSTTPPITEAELQAKLDDDSLYYLGFLPKDMSDSYIGDADPGAAFVNGKARATENRLGVLASAQSTFFFPPTYETITFGMAYVRDKLTFLKHITDTNIPTLRLVVTSSLDGHIKLQGDARAEVGAVMRLTDFRGDQYVHTMLWQNTTPGEYRYGNSVQNANAPAGSEINDSLVLSVNGPWFVFDPPDELDQITSSMTLEMLLYVQVRVGMEIPGLAGADFYNTMQAVNIQLLDADNQVASGFQIIGENGYVYPYNVIPEPATVSLLGLGVTVLITRHKRGKGR